MLVDWAPGQTGRGFTLVDCKSCTFEIRSLTEKKQLVASVALTLCAALVPHRHLRIQCHLVILVLPPYLEQELPRERQPPAWSQEVRDAGATGKLRVWHTRG